MAIAAVTFVHLMFCLTSHWHGWYFVFLCLMILPSVRLNGMTVSKVSQWLTG